MCEKTARLLSPRHDTAAEKEDNHDMRQSVTFPSSLLLLSLKLSVRQNR